MPRVTIDYTAAYEQSGGIGRYVRELTAALAAIDQDTDYRLFVAGAAKADLPAAPAPNFTWKATRINPRWLARIWQRARLPLPVETICGASDLFHATDFVLPPTLPGARRLLTVHDLSFLRVPAAASPSLKRYLEAVVPRSLKSAHHVLADSAATKADLIEFYGTAAEKITVLYSGVDARFQPVSDEAQLEKTLAKYGLAGRDYILSVGTVQPRKNYSAVIRALAQLRRQGLPLHYAIAGGPGWLQDEMHRTIKETDLRDSVHLLGFVADEDLPALYSGARMLLLVSLYEGFGLPVLEAMACGCPVITSNLSSLPEVAGTAALLVDPHDTRAIAAAIERLAADKETRARLIQAGYRQTRQFTWQRSAKQLKSIYESLLAG